MSAPGASCGLGALEAGGRVKEEGGRFSGDSAALVEGTLKDRRQEMKNSTQGATTIRYLHVNGDVLPPLQRSKDATAARGSLPLAELLEVHAKPTEALDVTVGARQS